MQLHVVGLPVSLDQLPPIKQPLLLNPFRSSQAFEHASAFAHAACGPQMDWSLHLPRMQGQFGAHEVQAAEWPTQWPPSQPAKSSPVHMWVEVQYEQSTSHGMEPLSWLIQVPQSLLAVQSATAPSGSTR
jgi:hypothetical protein